VRNSPARKGWKGKVIYFTFPGQAGSERRRVQGPRGLVDYGDFGDFLDPRRVPGVPKVHRVPKVAEPLANPPGVLEPPGSLKFSKSLKSSNPASF
jgi:hypothetical protein